LQSRGGRARLPMDLMESGFWGGPGREIAALRGGETATPGTKLRICLKALRPKQVVQETELKWEFW